MLLHLKHLADALIQRDFQSALASHVRLPWPTDGKRFRELSGKSINLSVYKLSYNPNKLNALPKQVWLTVPSIRLLLE